MARGNAVSNTSQNDRQDNQPPKAAAPTKESNDTAQSSTKAATARGPAASTSQSIGHESTAEIVEPPQPAVTTNPSVFDISPDPDTRQANRRASARSAKTATPRTGRPQKSSTTTPKPKPASQSTNVALAFEIIPADVPEHIYSVQGPEDGPDWQQLSKQNAYYQKITADVRLKYVAGDIVRLEFDEGPGGHGKIIEMRGDKIRGEEEFFLVVQWLYSRSDATRLKGKMPSMEKWPKNMWMLSDHFQVVGDENIEGASNLKPVDGVYWQNVSRSLKSQAELDQRLETQLQS